MMGLNEEQQQVLIDYQEVLPLATARKPPQAEASRGANG
jgi:hypothetical protein